MSRADRKAVRAEAATMSLGSVRTTAKRLERDAQAAQAVAEVIMSLRGR